MATTVENLTTSIENLTAELLAATENPKPFYVTPGGPDGTGQTVSAVEYRRFLSEEINRLIDLRTRLGQPWMQRIYGRQRR